MRVEHLGIVGDDGNLKDDYSHIIGIRDELMHTTWSGWWISRDAEGVQTRAEKILRREMLISLSFCVLYVTYYRESLNVDA